MGKKGLSPSGGYATGRELHVFERCHQHPRNREGCSDAQCCLRCWVQRADICEDVDHRCPEPPHAGHRAQPRPLQEMQREFPTCPVPLHGPQRNCPLPLPLHDVHTAEYAMPVMATSATITPKRIPRRMFFVFMILFLSTTRSDTSLPSAADAKPAPAAMRRNADRSSTLAFRISTDCRDADP